MTSSGLLQFVCRHSDSQTYSLCKQAGNGVADLYKLLVFRAFKDEIVGERLEPCHLSRRKDARQFGMEVDTAVVFLDRTGGLVPRALFPGVGVAFIKAFTFGALHNAPLHFGVVAGRDVVESWVFGMILEVANSLTSCYILIGREDGLGMIVFQAVAVADEYHTFPFLRGVVVGSA